jgi:hypothetical protein
VKNILYITIAIFFVAQVGCKKEPEKFKIKGRVMDGTTGQRFKGLTFTVYTKGGTANKIIDDLGSFTTNDSGDFEFMYDRIKGISANSISVINNFMKFKDIPLNKDVDKVFYKSTLGKFKIICNCPNIKNTDTLFVGYSKLNSNNVFRQVIDTLTNVYKGYNYTLITPPNEEWGIVWGVNSNTFAWKYHQGNINIVNYLGSVTGKVTGDPIVDEFEIKY